MRKFAWNVAWFALKLALLLALAAAGVILNHLALRWYP